MSDEPRSDDGARAESDEAVEHRHGIRRLLTWLVVVVVFVLFYLAQELLRPIVLAVLLNLVLHGPVCWLEKLRIPRPVGAALAILAIGGAIVVGFSQLTEPATRWMDKAPQAMGQLESKIREVRKPVEEMTRAAEQVQDMTEIGDEKKTKVQIEEPSAGEAMMEQLQLVVSNLILILILLFLLLVYGDDVVKRLIAQFSGTSTRRRAMVIAEYVEQRVSRYLLTISMINAGLGVSVGLVAYFVGLPSPWLWGTMAALLNFVPYLGAAVGVVIVGLVALTSVEPVGRALLAPILYMILTSLEGMVITPVTVGSRFSLNPLIVFVWLLLWGWMWGISGALIAIPLLTVLKVLADYIPSWKPLAAVIARERETPGNGDGNGAAAG